VIMGRGSKEVLRKKKGFKKVGRGGEGRSRPKSKGNVHTFWHDQPEGKKKTDEELSESSRTGTVIWKRT